MSSEARHPENTILTMQLGLALTLLISLMFLSAGLFYLYHFNYDIGPYFTATRAIHFYAGLASIPFLIAKYGSTGLRFAGYYLRVPRFVERGPPRLLPRILSPLLALDFFVLYFSGLYMLFHYYYTVANIPPGDFRPVQVHLWASIIAVPLVAAHLGSHLIETIRGLRDEIRHPVSSAASGTVYTRRAFLTTVFAGALGLSFGLQNTTLQNREAGGLFIGRIPKEERGGPGDFPVEVLFGKEPIDRSAWRLQLTGAVSEEMSLSYAQIAALPAVTKKVRLSCVSGWSAVPTWTGPRVREVLSLAGFDAAAKSVNFHSVSGYGFTWHIDPVLGDDALLATHVNGAELSENHGFPVRLIVPGYPGQNMVKQLDRITVRMEKERFDPDLDIA
jgi:hypothetical protein